MATIFIIVAIWFFMKIDWCIGRDGITIYLLSNLQYLTGGLKPSPTTYQFSVYQIYILHFALCILFLFPFSLKLTTDH